MPSRTSKMSPSEEGFGDKMKRMTENGLQSTGLGFYKMKHHTKISLLETKINTRQKQFGVDYLTMVGKRAPERELRRCLKKALTDIADLRDQIEESLDKIDDKKIIVQQKMRLTAVEIAPVKKIRKYGPPSAGTSSGVENSNKHKNPRDNSDNSMTSNTSSTSKSYANFPSPAATNNRSKHPGKFRSPAAKNNRSKHHGNFPSSAATSNRSKNHEKFWSPAVTNSRSSAVAMSKNGGSKIKPPKFQRLIPFKDDILPQKYRDKYTDSMTFRGQKLVTSKKKAIMPGRGMGPGDTPGLKIIGDVDPSDVFQGSVGDCWLLSGISGVAGFDGAIERLFRKTRNLDKMPMDKGSTATGNMYTVTLWDLKTWKEVDIVIDERLPAHYNGSGELLAAKPSKDGELWACYLEKALAIHCGGWDKIEGGQCTHAWSLLTGCREQYQMKRNPETGNWRCFSKQNPKTKVWAEHANSPKDQRKTTWRVHWPEVGGGDHRDEEMNDDQMFQKLFAWDQENYIVAAGTHGTSDKQSTGGLVDNHSYTIIETVSNCAGTGIDLLKVRNPWGTGEIEDGEFDDDGPGWDKYPQIKKALKPVASNDGIFWVTTKEFFKYFKTIYLSASNMTKFVED